MAKVSPSGAARAQASMPMIDEAPGPVLNDDWLAERPATSGAGDRARDRSVQPKE